MSDAEFRWVRVRCQWNGWMLVNLDFITDIHRAGYGFIVKMASGSTILLTAKSAARLFNRLPVAIRPKPAPRRTR